MKGKTGSAILVQAPQLLERFEILKPLGEGAAGAVYQVRDRANGNRVVALKILCNRNAFDENTTQRFHEELRICQQLNHPHLVRAFEAVSDGEVLGFIMEYIDGADLRMLLGKPRPALNVI